MQRHAYVRKYLFIYTVHRSEDRVLKAWSFGLVFLSSVGLFVDCRS